jgi:hypothetical protein
MVSTTGEWERSLGEWAGGYEDAKTIGDPEVAAEGMMMKRRRRAPAASLISCRRFAVGRASVLCAVAGRDTRDDQPS